MKLFKPVSCIFLCLLAGTAAHGATHSGIVKVYTPFNSQVSAESRGPNDLTFSKMRSIFAKAKYRVQTNEVGAGSGTITVLGKDYICTYDIYYDQYWRANSISPSRDAACKTSFVDNNLLLTVQK
jgi:hypothetical protein